MGFILLTRFLSVSWKQKFLPSEFPSFPSLLPLSCDLTLSPLLGPNLVTLGVIPWHDVFWRMHMPFINNSQPLLTLPLGSKSECGNGVLLPDLQPWHNLSSANEDASLWDWRVEKKWSHWVFNCDPGEMGSSEHLQQPNSCAAVRRWQA